MAYGDYGGFAYKDGEHVPDRSDTSVRDSLDDILSAHVMLGDSDVRVLLYKQADIKLIHQGRIIDMLPLVDQKYLDSWTSEEGVTTTYIDTNKLASTGEPCSFEIGEHKITIYWTEEDNLYQYVELVQPDGTVWTGFSGYGVGSGFENEAYGFSNSAREKKLFTLFPRKKL